MTLSPIQNALLVSYATANFSQAARLLIKSAANYSLNCKIYDVSHPVVSDLTLAFPKIMSTMRGAGYWAWKPHIILDAMLGLPEGTPVLYTDVAVTVIADPRPLLALCKTHPIVLFGGTHHRQQYWTKRDCFIELNADSQRFWDLNQLCGGFQLYRTGNEARAFLEKLAAVSTNLRAISDDENCLGKPNLSGFQEHRHDQSVLTILAEKENIPVFDDPSQYGLKNTRGVFLPGEHIFHLHRLRDKPFINLLLRRLRRHYTGGRRFY